MISGKTTLPEGFIIKGEGIGDVVQFTSLPENYYRATGRKLVDCGNCWAFDYNPYVLRNVEDLSKVYHMWNYFCPEKMDHDPLPHVRGSVYMTNAEIHLAVTGHRSPHLIRPKLYKFENSFKRDKILFHPFGKSHGALPKEVIDHVIKKYKGQLTHLAVPSDPHFMDMPRIEPDSYWSLACVISQHKMLIGVDSGPAWVAACYPDVIVKKIRVGFQDEKIAPKDWVPLSEKNPHAIWDDRTLFKMYWCGEDDLGFMESYRKI